MTTPHTNNHGLWIDETNSAAWAEALRCELLTWLAPLAGVRPEEIDGFSVEVASSTEEQAREAMEKNTDLRGRITLAWGETRFDLEAPMPYHGVFLSHRSDSTRSLVSVWTSWLAEKPGFRLVRPTSMAKRKRDEKQWRLGLPGGRFIGGSLAKPAEKSWKNAYFGNPEAFPEWLRSEIAVIGLKGLKESAMPTRWVQLLDENEQQLGEAVDQEHLSHRILMTYPVWLKHWIAREFLQSALLSKTGKQVLAVLKGEEDGSKGLAEEVWQGVVSAADAVSRRLVVAIHNARSKDHADLVDPINPLDLAARITRVKRIHLAASKLEEMPADFRQNHPSYQGCICAVDSPESSQVGLTLHLAAGATVDFNGQILSATAPHLELSYGAGLVPFFAHNDGVRNMMGAKNLRQAEPVRGRQRPKVESGGEVRLMDFIGKAVSIGACRKSDADDGAFALGRDLLVAYLPWEGLNFEDAVVIGQQVVDQGWMDVTLSHVPVRKSIPVGWLPEGVTPGEVESPANQSPRDETKHVWEGEMLTDRERKKGNSGQPAGTGMAKIGSTLHTGDVIARFIWEGAEEVQPLVIRYQERTPAVLKSVRFSRRQPWTTGVLVYEVETPIPVKPGDKLMGRHGNKGVVGAILPTDRMPRLPDHDGIPEHLRGRAIDILLNPHGVISRMNLGQLLETHLGWVLHAGKNQISDLLKAGTPEEALPAEAFSEVIDHSKVRTALKATGLDEYGKVRLELPGGEQTQSPVVVGFQHIVRLKHIPETKSQARRGGKESLYSSRTGQAVHGRRSGGGQRIGEMEEWALAAHGANEVLAEMLGVKSTVEVACNWTPGEEDGSVPVNGFSSLFRDWLFAMRLEIESNDHGVDTLGLASEEKVLQYAGPWGHVTSPGGLTVAPSARFRCAEGGKRKPCGFEVLRGIGIPFPQTAGGKENNKKTLRLDDLLAHLELRISGPVTKIGSNFLLPLFNINSGKDTHPLLLEIETGSDFLKICAKQYDTKLPTGWPESIEHIHLYGRFGRGGGEKGNLSGRELLEEFQSEERGVRNIGEMSVTCPDHRSKAIQAVEPFRTIRRGATGGLFDPVIFGDSTIKTGEVQFARWGYIDLPIEVSYPLEVISPKIAKDAKRNGTAFPKMTRIPVLPIRYRRPTVRGNAAQEDDLDRLGYAPLLRLCLSHRKAQHEADVAKSDDDREKVAKRLELSAKRIEDQVAKLFGMLADGLRGKSGLIRRHGLGRRVDRSARLVATPNPKLEWDQVGIPAAVLLELMGDVVAAWKVRQQANDGHEVCISGNKPASGMTHDELEAAVHGLLEAWREGNQAEKDEVVLALLVRSTWREAVGNPSVLDAALDLLSEFLTAHPDYVVLLNRQPSLHRDSVQAFRPIPLPPQAGDVLQLCPLVCKGFALDFDGDEMAVHVPLGAAAQAEARQLQPSVNLFSMANSGPDSVLAHFDQDFVLGTWWIGVDPDGTLRNRLMEMLPSDDCRRVIGVSGPITKKQGQQLLHHLAIEHPKEAAEIAVKWMRLAFETCTRIGVSFGYCELQDLAATITPEVVKTMKGPATSINGTLDEIAAVALENILENPTDTDRPCLHLAAMALSGARGKKQIRQLIAARGNLDPGATCFDRTGKERNFTIASSLVEGVSSDEAFWAAMNARSSMCDKKLGTGHAGGLTRHLVFALRPHTIVSDDCSDERDDKERSLSTCKETRGFCSKCYGKLQNLELPKVGFQAGLIAAQSIGERGTQLSMQSFHAGKKEIDIREIRKMLGLAGKSEFLFREDGEAKKFIQKFREAPAYQDLDERHLLLTWIVLHRTMLAAKSGEKAPTVSVKSAVEAGNTLDRIAYRDPGEILVRAVLEGVPIDGDSPFATLML